MHLRVLTYNVQARPIADNIDNEPRSAEIARRIAASRHDYDIVCLNEVFDEDARAKFIDGLKGKYPHFVGKIGGGQFLSSMADADGAGWVALSFGLAIVTLGVLNLAESNDSGLMIFSRYPIDIQDIAVNGGTERRPAMVWAPYSAATGTDALAEKGALTLRLALPSGEKFVITASHMQADDEDDGKNQTIRASQLGQLRELMLPLIQDGPVEHDFAVVGDLNVNGVLHSLSDATTEWKDLLAFSSGPPRDLWWDSWSYEQSPGLGISPRFVEPPRPYDVGVTAPTVNGDRRYDYGLIRPNRSGARHLQHAFIDVELADTNASFPFLSDHRPLVLDLYPRDRGGMSVIDAMDIFCTEVAPNVELRGHLQPGAMHWACQTIDGTYDVSSAGCELNLYASDNLSRPLQPYKVLVTGAESIAKYVLPAAPIFVKIAARDRYKDSHYLCSFVRYFGTSLDDAIELPKRRVETAHHKSGTRTSNSETIMGDGSKVTDARYFAFDVIRPTSGATQTITAVLEPKFGSVAQRVLICTRLQNNSVSVLANSSFSTERALLSLSINAGHYFVIVERAPDGGRFGRSEFTFSWDSDLSLLFGPQAYKSFRTSQGTNPLASLLPPADLLLKCVKETDSVLNLGSDDLAIKVFADARLLKSIPNSQIGDFDSDDVRPLDAWLDEPVTYVSEMRLHLIEEDDLSGDDKGNIIFSPMHRYLKGSGGQAVIRADRSVVVTERVSFDGGEYAATATIA